ncbi:hypothetical protein L21SP4_00776 [Kiritimatiella glycovorans]|uniref:Lipoprotein n=2 Tax=Kiritimatiella glycovorans TaxID=1307763 RepID=A0A0G3EC18_9BACT|nr:hypothetical protein L21SP4_00776 [Kiritimatiella glycovorans]
MTSPKRPNKHVIAGIGLVLLAAASALFSGCAGYQVGTRPPEGVKTVYIAPPVNRSGEPMIESRIMHEITRELQQDGTFALASESGADARLEIVLRDYRLQPLAYEDVEEARTREYRMKIRADVTLRRTESGAVIAERAGVLGESDFFVNAPLGGIDLPSSKRIGLIPAAQDLAENIIDAVVERW